jgi:hypothetical protein
VHNLLVIASAFPPSQQTQRWTGASFSQFRRRITSFKSEWLSSRESTFAHIYSECSDLLDHEDIVIDAERHGDPFEIFERGAFGATVPAESHELSL